MKMHKWMDQWTSWMSNRCMNRWVPGWVKGCNGWKDGCRDGWRNRAQMGAQMERLIRAWPDNCMNAGSERVRCELTAGGCSPLASAGPGRRWGRQWCDSLSATPETPCHEAHPAERTQVCCHQPTLDQACVNRTDQVSRYKEALLGLGSE